MLCQTRPRQPSDPLILLSIASARCARFFAVSTVMPRADAISFMLKLL